jgi:hypothetical protein
MTRRPCHAALLPIRERILGRAVLPIRERVHGPDHPDTLAARASLAYYWTGQAGDAAGARDQYAKLLPIRERILGPDHPRTLATRANLARWTEQVEHAHDSSETPPVKAE